MTRRSSWIWPPPPWVSKLATLPGMEEMANQLQGCSRTRARNQEEEAQDSRSREAMKALIEEEAARLVNPEELKQKAIASVENNGIVFLDEIDKICARRELGPGRFP